jgi:hypothetical protein
MTDPTPTDRSLALTVASQEKPVHTTNYYDTFIEIAEDCPTAAAEVPPRREGKPPTVANLHFDLVADAPYARTSDDVIFTTHAVRAGITDADLAAARDQFFSKGQACLRASPLAKRYGWGIHHDAKGRIALVPAGSEEYDRLAADPAITHLKAMRSKRA